MSAAQHTPGPWEVVRLSCVEDVDLEIRSTSFLTCGYAPIAKVRGDKRLVTRAIRQANAHLIAAAPDLLAALQELLPMFEEWHSDFPAHVGDKEAPALSAAWLAIAKATGEPA